MKFSQRQILVLISIVLVAATFVAYEPIRHSGFILLDDQWYVTDNPHVTGGITKQSIVWAFTKSYASNWHPLTWLSHMLDCEIYGLNPLGHHITSVLIHIANSVLLFWVLRKMTGIIWPSAFVAAIFALHPVHVESVAWASERKDVLSGLFWMLTMLAYARYAERPNFKRYVLVLLAFAMGLMAKPMVVTLPFVLLLLDYWPLGRFLNFKRSLPNLLLEKVPLFVLSAVSSVITFVVQKQSGAVVGLENWPFYIRAVNAVGCYFNYVIKMLYPKGLAVFYPVPEKMTIDAAALTVIGAAILLVRWRQGRPWLVVGLLWYLGTLVPVIGLVQVGEQIMADRYTYLPSIGVFIIIAWAASEILAKLSHPKPVAAGAIAAALIAMVLLTRIQAGFWQDSGKLYKHALAVTKNNYFMLDGYGLYLCKQGKYEEGMRYFEQATSIAPNFMPVWDNICTTLLVQKRLDEAINCLIEALQKAKDWPYSYRLSSRLGWAYEQKGDLGLAETNFRKALAMNPDFEPAQTGLASVLAKQQAKSVNK